MAKTFRLLLRAHESAAVGSGMAGTGTHGRGTSATAGGKNVVKNGRRSE
jgi:hypothetical protein